MFIERKSPINGIVNIVEINITPEQYRSWYEGKLLQDVAPHLTADEREFIISGCTPQEWDDLFGESEE